MKLKEYLSIESPTLEQLEETETLLHGAIDKASKQLVDLDTEDRGQALNRLRGEDKGADERRVARENVERDRSDAAEVLAGIQSKIATEKARLDKLAEDKAWAEVEGHLARRKAAMQQIEKLTDKIAGLYGTMMDAYRDATQAAPRKPIERGSTVQGYAPGQVGGAIAVHLHALLGHPLSVSNMADGGLEPLERIIRVNGLAAYLEPTEKLILSGKV